MSLVDLLLAAEAARDGKAVRRTAYRHQHVADSPLVITAFNLSGEAAAPLGIMYGTDPSATRASLVVAPEPRNASIRFGAINQFSVDLHRFVTPFLQLEDRQTRYGSTKGAAAAPQIVVPNRATRAYLGQRLGRSLRYLGFTDTPPPDETLWAGSHLSWLAQHENLPGQSVFLAMTESLGRLYATGQSALEDENLAVLLGWVDGFSGDVLNEVEKLEEMAFGPVPNTDWERTLVPMLERHNVAARDGRAAEQQTAAEEIERAVRDELSPAYEACHRALSVLQSIDPAPSVAARWKADVREWSSHARRAANGIPTFVRRDGPLRAARNLQRWSRAQDELAVTMAFEDPLVLAKLDADGRCITGVVAAVNLDNRETKPRNKRMSSVPIFDVQLTAPTKLLKADIVRLAADQRVRCEIRSVGETVTVAVLEQAKAFRNSQFATPGEEVVLVGLDPWAGMDPDSPNEVPWTHNPDEEPDNETNPAPDDDPDLPADELAQPVRVDVGPDDIPGALV